jgi:transcriptional regulator with XRE-family HTH domain
MRNRELTELGDRLKSAREQRGVHLQATADQAEITATCLLRLERGQATTPSPHVLRRLGHVLGLPYLQLMGLAGYLDDEELATARARSPPHHPLVGDDLSPDEWREVTAFIRQLTERREQRSPNGSSAGTVIRLSCQGSSR